MTKPNLYVPKTINELLKNTIGFDQFFSGNTLLDTQAYPPHNLIETGDNQYLIEIAVAGFDSSQLFVTLKENTLHVVGEPGTPKFESGQYIRRGIAARKFSLAFALAPQVEVKESNYDNGILSIILERVIPEEQKPRQIPINTDRKLLLG